MIILGVETATQAASVVLASPQGPIAASMLGPGLPGLSNKHGSFVATAIQQMLDQTGVTPQDISGVALSIGPGLFTGLRVGMATAQVFAQTRNLPMVTKTSLEIIAQSVPVYSGLIVPIIDARRKEVFYGAYTHSGDEDASLRCVWEPARATPVELATHLQANSQQPVLLLGNGVEPVAQAITEKSADITVLHQPVLPQAQHLVDLAMPDFLAQKTVTPDAVKALYLRDPDALLPSNENLLDPALLV